MAVLNKNVQILGTSIFLHFSSKDFEKWNEKKQEYFFISLDDQDFCKKILNETSVTKEKLEFIKSRHKDHGLENFELSSQNFKSFCGR